MHLDYLVRGGRIASPKHDKSKCRAPIDEAFYPGSGDRSLGIWTRNVMRQGEGAMRRSSVPTYLCMARERVARRRPLQGSSEESARVSGGLR